jgi:trk system potassium uptake protein TrkA
MRAIIIGGGKVGYFLVKTLLERNMRVTLIEKDKDRASQISKELNIDVLWGDGSDLSILQEANINDCELVAAVTGSDEENLVVCQIVKLSFNNTKTIARINNPKNIKMFRQLGVDKTVCSTEVIANLINAEMVSDGIKIIQTFEMGTMLLAEINISEKHKWLNKEIKDIALPRNLVVVSILRNDEVIYPKGDTLLHVEDKVVFVCDKETISGLKKYL